MTGNGTFDANTPGGRNYGESFVKLKLETARFVVKDYFTPCNQAFLTSLDLDLGSGGPVLIPGTNLLYGGGKEGNLYLLSRTNMGKYAASPTAPNCKNPNAVQEFAATELHVFGAGTWWGHIHGSPVFWKGPDRSRAYVWGENDRLKAYTFQQGKFVNVDAPTAQHVRGAAGEHARRDARRFRATAPRPAPASCGRWCRSTATRTRSRGVQGIVLALDAQDVSRQLWTSELSGPRDRLGLFAKFVPPTVAGGKVFVATYGNKEPNVRPAAVSVALLRRGLRPAAADPTPQTGRQPGKRRRGRDQGGRDARPCRSPPRAARRPIRAISTARACWRNRPVRRSCTR